jgi:hypothetical protein
MKACEVCKIAKNKYGDILHSKEQSASHYNISEFDSYIQEHNLFPLQISVE